MRLWRWPIRVAILYAVTKGYLEQVEVEQVSAYEEELHRLLDTRRRRS